jgi:hypothetical protein
MNVPDLVSLALMYIVLFNLTREAHASRDQTQAAIEHVARSQQAIQSAATNSG